MKFKVGSREMNRDPWHNRRHLLCRIGSTRSVEIGEIVNLDKIELLSSLEPLTFRMGRHEVTPACWFNSRRCTFGTLGASGFEQEDRLFDFGEYVLVDGVLGARLLSIDFVANVRLAPGQSASVPIYSIERSNFKVAPGDYDSTSGQFVESVFHGEAFLQDGTGVTKITSDQIHKGDYVTLVNSKSAWLVVEINGTCAKIKRPGRGPRSVVVAELKLVPVASGYGRILNHTWVSGIDQHGSVTKTRLLTIGAHIWIGGQQKVIESFYAGIVTTTDGQRQYMCHCTLKY